MFCGEMDVSMNLLTPCMRYDKTMENQCPNLVHVGME